MKLPNKNVLITGGASGIGKLMGRMALERGASCVIIWDINQENIEKTCEEFRALGEVRGYIVDVSDSAWIKETYRRVCDDCGGVDVVINNAGVVTSNKTFEHQTEEEILRTININTIAPMLVTRVILPDMLRRHKGHICTIASAGGMLGNPKMTVYGASKWAAIGWSESLRIEMQMVKSGVRVTTVAPYYISTGMFDGVKSRFIPILKPEYVARKVLNAIERNKVFLGLPFSFRFIRFWQGLLPMRFFDWFFGEFVGVYHTMDDFRGRKRL